MMVTPSGQYFRLKRLPKLTTRVSCVRFSPNPVIPVIVSAGWDKVVKVSLQFRPLIPPHHPEMM